MLKLDSFFKRYFGVVIMTKMSFQKVMSFINSKIKDVNSQSVLNKSSLGLQRKNLLKNECFDAVIKSEDLERNISCKVQDDGSMVFNGTNPKQPTIFYWNIANGAVNRNDAYNNGSNLRWIKPGKYIVSGGSANISIQMRVSNNPDSEGDTLGMRCYTEEVVVDIPDKPYVWARIYIDATDNINNEVVRPMFRPFEIPDSTYEPYTPDLQEQINEIFGYGKLLPEGTDLNNVTDPGIFRGSGADKINCPVTNSAFKLVVEKLYPSSNDRLSLTQTIYPHSRTDGCFYMRNRINNTWGSWFRFVGEEVIDGEVQVSD